MHIEHDDELTPAERAAFEALPRERMPSDVLEERTVNALKHAGLLTTTTTASPSWRIPPTWLALAAAASVALFASGVVLGQYISARHSAETIAALREADTREAAALIQQTGSAY